MLYAIVAALVLILDQGLKYWVTLNMVMGESTRELIPGVLHLTHLHNYGAAFSLLQNQTWLFLIVTVLFCAAVIFMLATGKISGALGRWSALLVMAGALGNGVDRAIYGYVVDMLAFDPALTAKLPSFLSFLHPFPVFNLADCFITVCGVLFCLYVIFHRDPLPDGGASRSPDKRSDGRGGRRPGNEKRNGGGTPPTARRAPAQPAAPPPFVNPFEEPAVPDGAAVAAAAKSLAAVHITEPELEPQTAPPTPVRTAPQAAPPVPVRTAQPVSPNLPVREAPKAAPAEKDEYSLESILAEFGDE